jgi:hypothetical protein
MSGASACCALGLGHAFVALVDAFIRAHPRVLRFTQAAADAGRRLPELRDVVRVLMSKHATSCSLAVPIIVGVQPFAQFSETYLVVDVTGWMASRRGARVLHVGRQSRLSGPHGSSVGFIASAAAIERACRGCPWP